ncbi:phosphotransferase enzyme family protein [Streptomonospora salina]|uniref:Aminoglycoside phosphotransferase (APT) family kinase protein n=1 Tax=Streptomonospora salina TaxID=104205 RepID=A0A841EDC3_9ACTN|nr:aminoglycoside phosphotransferase family protein [Streptomonospora salina]MBB5998460.1 aminoglycoside phosphotransferase (APT) family kinase protein [Streptomonospora salina]
MTTPNTTFPENDALTRERLSEILAQVCAAAGLDPRGARLIKFTNNAAFVLPADSVVVRIAGSAPVRDRATTVVNVARWLAEHEVPAVRLLPGVEQPVMVGVHAATLWHYTEPSGPAPGGADLGRILHRIHSLPPPAFDLPRWDPVPKFRRRIDDAEGLPAGDRDWLRSRCDELDAELTRLDYALHPGAIHGDAFVGNLIPGPDGPVICDFDSVSVGPREWDLTPAAVGKVRMDYAEDAHTPLAAGYGFDVMDWPGFATLRRVRELQLVTSVLPNLVSNPGLREQWEHRYRTLRADDTRTRWSTYR